MASSLKKREFSFSFLLLEERKKQVRTKAPRVKTRAVTVLAYLVSLTDGNSSKRKDPCTFWRRMLKRAKRISERGRIGNDLFPSKKSLITVMNDNHHDKAKEREKKPSVYHAINGV